MNLNNFTIKAQEAVQQAVQLVTKNNQQVIEPVHLLKAVIMTGESVTNFIFQKLGVNAQNLNMVLDRQIESYPKVSGGEPYLSSESNAVLQKAIDYSSKMGDQYVSLEPIILALFTEKSTASQILKDAGVTEKELRQAIEELRKGNKVTSQSAEETYDALGKYAINLNERARSGKLDPVIGRDEEIRRVLQILSRRTKNNPCLIGEPGVGKTAVVEGLARKIVEEDIPEILHNKRVLTLDLAGMVAGSKYRGEFEERIKRSLKEVMQSGNILLFIDEIHTIIGAGGAEGAIDAANILKPALSRGEIQVIGATTFAEYRKYIEKDSALERRFQPVTVNEPSLEEAVAILRGVAHYYEVFHGVTIPPEMARQAVVLSERYITDRFLPDKAIDLLDEACSDLNLHSKEISDLAEKRKERDDYQLEIKMLTEDTEQQDNFERLAKLRSNVCRLDAEIAELEAKPAPVLTMENLARIIELWTKIPASKIRAQEYAQLRELEDRLKQHIIGQDEAVHAVAAAIRRNRVGIAVKKHPVSFIFVGSTGVGKTELVKCLANELFDSVDSLIRLDMSEYMERHSVSKLIGSPPGYVGYDEAGQLTEKIRRKPYSVILFDELEKAHPDVLNLLLQILEEGTLTAADGKRADFRSSIVIMTGNIGAEQLSKNTLGFGSGQQDDGESEVLSELKKRFSPELINRIDNVVVFRKLGEEQMESICRILLRKLTARAQLCGIELSFTNDAVKHLCRDSSSGRERGMGARPLRRTITAAIENMLSGMMISGGLRSGSRAEVCEQSGLLSVRVLSTQ